ncbi:hypothetical protein AAKU58_000488 [Oxalobacteraceae bacterium GrIS 1.18]
MQSVTLPSRREMMEPFEIDEVKNYSDLLVASFAQMTKRRLVEGGADLSRRLFEAPFALVSHGTEEDPIFKYANRTALTLWGMSWEEFTVMPSRLSAEPMLQAERNQLLEEAQRKGYVDTYQGVRIAKDGRRFTIKDTVLWNVADAWNIRQGQACVIYRWDYLPV